MAKREYNGPPLDGTGGHDGNGTPPWANDGETVDATGSEDPGEMTTEDFDFDQLQLNGEEGWIPTEEQVANAREILLSGKMSGGELADVYGIPHAVLSNYIGGKNHIDPEKPPAIEGDNNGSYTIKQQDGPGETDADTDESDAHLEPEEVAKMRERAIDGETASEIANDYTVSSRQIQRRLTGDGSTPSVGSPPELEYDRSEGWRIPENGSEPDVGDAAGVGENALPLEPFERGVGGGSSVQYRVLEYLHENPEASDQGAAAAVDTSEDYIRAIRNKVSAFVEPAAVPFDIPDEPNPQKTGIVAVAVQDERSRFDSEAELVQEAEAAGEDETPDIDISEIGMRYYQDGDSLEEIAADFDLSVNQVSGYLAQFDADEVVTTGSEETVTDEDGEEQRERGHRENSGAGGESGFIAGIAVGAALVVAVRWVVDVVRGDSE